jgi:hypothetical protein
MATVKGRGKTVIGLFVDGLDVKLAHLSINKKKIIIEDLKSARLSSKLQDHKVVEEITAHAGDAAEGFNVPVTPIQDTSPSTQTEDNNAVLYGLLASYPRSRYSLTYSLSEPAIYYHQLESDFGLKGGKLKERILSELRSVRAFQPSPDAVDSLRTDEGNLLCVIREDGMSLLNALDNIKGYIGNRLPLIAAIDSSDVSLLNLVRTNYELDPNDVSVVVYVGTEFTRLIFMRGSHFYQFAPILGEGYDSPNLQNTVYSRLLLEQDNLAIPHIRRIILAGQSHRIGLGDFLSQQLPDQEIEYLFTPRLDATTMPPELQEAIPEYAIPIGSAMRALLAGEPTMYHINLLPASVREGQRAFQLAWHGYLLLGSLFLATLFFTWQISGKARDLRDMHDLLALKESQRAENMTLATSIQNLEEQLARYRTSMALYDSLVPGGDRWSRSLTQLSHGVDDLNSIWLTDLTGGTDGDMNMSGCAVYRTRIPRLATLFDNSLLEEVNVQEIRKETVYKYRIKVPTAAPSSQ